MIVTHFFADDKYEPPITHTEVTIDDLRRLNEYVSENTRKIKEKQRKEWDERLANWASTASAITHKAKQVVLNARQAHTSTTLNEGLYEAESPDIGPVSNYDSEGPRLWISTIWDTLVHRLRGSKPTPVGSLSDGLSAPLIEEGEDDSMIA